ncbi:Tn3 family transposase [Vibrio alginolyticus]
MHSITIHFPDGGVTARHLLLMVKDSRPEAAESQRVTSTQSMGGSREACFIHISLITMHLIINSPARDATYVLDGLLNHESELDIEEHYTDTAGFADHVFSLMPILGFKFVPRIRDLSDKRLYIADKKSDYPMLGGLIGGEANFDYISLHWEEILRLSASIGKGAVTASLC